MVGSLELLGCGLNANDAIHMQTIKQVMTDFLGRKLRKPVPEMTDRKAGHDRLLGRAKESSSA